MIPVLCDFSKEKISQPGVYIHRSLLPFKWLYLIILYIWIIRTLLVSFNPNQRDMKTLFTLIVLLTSFVLNAQERGDNTIIIPNFPKERIDDLEMHILSNFYQFQNMDKDNIRFMTHPKPIEGSIYAYDLQLTIIGMLIGDDLVMYGTYSFNTGSDSYSGRADFQRRKLVGRRMAFDELDKVAKGFGLPIRYEKRD